MSLVDRCRVIAEIAHTAAGQKRADGITPYIVHPMRVAELTRFWGTMITESAEALDFLVGAAWLHDVVEDTKVTLDALERWSIPPPVIFLVDLLTKKNRRDEPETPEYYGLLMQYPSARLIKCADVCANLEDIIHEIAHGCTGKRWKNYIARARKLPELYAEERLLRAELERRLERLDEAIMTTIGRDPHERYARLGYKYGS